MTKDAKLKQDHDEVYEEFKSVVNMTASTLEKYLDSDESQTVGQKKSDGEATGHQEGRRIVGKLHKKADLTNDDYTHMRKVVGYVHWHLKQGGPKDEDAVEELRWRLSLLNWGHDPLKN